MKKLLFLLLLSSVVRAQNPVPLGATSVFMVNGDLVPVQDIVKTGYGTIAVTIYGTWSGTVSFQGGVNAQFTSTYPIRAYKADDPTVIQTSTTSNGTFILNTLGFGYVRVRMTSYTSGLARAVSWGYARLLATPPTSASAGGGSEDGATETTLLTLTGKIPALGQTTMANGLPVTLASNQSAIPVTGSFWQATQPVSGPLTDAQLRATPVPVSGGFLTDAQLRASPVPISGALTDAQLRASPIEVIVTSGGGGGGAGTEYNDGTADATPTGTLIMGYDGTNVQALASNASGVLTTEFTNTTIGVTGTFWQAVQPVSQSGTWNIGTIATITNPVSISGTVPVSGTFWQATQPISGTVAATQSGTWNLTNISGTVSLPTGASTSALQTTGNSSLASIDGKITAVNTGAVVISSGTLTAVTSITNPVTVTGTVTSNIGTTNGLALDATLTGGTQQTKITDGTNVATVKAASTAAVAADKAVVVAISPNNSVAVTGTFWQATQPVSGTFWQATQPVSGTVAATQSGTWNIGTVTTLTGITNPVAVTGTFWQATQPVSGTVAATQSGTWNVGTVTTLTSITNAVAVTGTFWQATQPVSGTITANLAAGTNNIGDVDVLTLPALAAGTNNIGDVDVLTLPALPAGNNNIGDVDVIPPTLVKGTQGSTGFMTQDIKDAGRTEIMFRAVAAAAGTTGTETAITLTKSAGTAATSTGTSFVVTSGKRFRITHISIATRGHATATIQTTTFNIRINTGGAVTTGSTPIIFSARSATPATASAWDRYIVDLGEGYEILGDGTLQFGVTAAATYTTNAPTWDITIIGYEY